MTTTTSDVPVPQQLLRRLQDAPNRGVPVDQNPMARSLGACLESHDIEAGELVVSFLPDPCFVQGAGMVQGGILGAMLDFAMAFAAFGAVPSGHHVSTANLQVAFLRPAPLGRFVAVAKVERCGKTLVFTRAGLSDAKGLLVATGTSTLAVSS